MLLFLLLPWVEVAPDKSSLVVRISVQETILQEGQELRVTCSVDTHNLVERFFSVAWLRVNVELARIGPTGVLSVGGEYSSREKQGELRAARIRDRDYHLVLQPVRTQDQGEYVCRAWPQDRGTDGSFTQGAAQDSRSQLVTISATGQSAPQLMLTRTQAQLCLLSTVASLVSSHYRKWALGQNGTEPRYG